MSDNDDGKLLTAWRDGDAAAGETFVERHFLSVYRFFSTKLPEEADDLTQRTFVDLQRKLDRVREANSIRAYLMTIARNNLYMHLRRRVAHDGVFDPSAISVAQLGVAASPSLAMAKRREQRLLLGALRSVPVETQVLLELYYWENLKVRDIASILDVAPGTVMSRLARARERLRKAMDGLGEEPALVSSTMADLEAWAENVRPDLSSDDDA